VTEQPYPILTLSADLGGSVGQQTGVFEMRKATVSERVRTGPLVDNGLSQAISAITRALDVDSLPSAGITINNNAGQHVWDIDAELIGADGDGQWGSSSDPADLNAGTATGGDRTQKAQVFLRYLEKASTDSFAPAELQYGEYAPSGFMPEDSVSVFIEDPENAVDRGSSSTTDISLTAVQTPDLSGALTGTQRLD